MAATADAKTGTPGGARAGRWTLAMPALIIFVWANAALITIIAMKPSLTGLPLWADDALRLVQIRDLLAGQSWFDLTQYRLDPPHGVAMHWTRVVDGPIAALILGFRTIMTPRAAETLAICVWPLLLLLPALFALVRIATRIADRETGVAVLILALGCMTTLVEFHPGAIDHSNLQIVLTLWSVAFLIDFETDPRAPIYLGMVSALSLAIGLETLPYQLVTALVAAAIWIRDGTAAAGAVRRFGLSFAGSVLVLSFAVIAPHERYSVACDTLSGLYSTLAITGGAGLAAATLLPRLPARLSRTLVIGALAAVLFAIVLAANPQCLRGPYAAIDPELDRIWLSHILEARSPFSYIAKGLPGFISGYAYACFCVAAAIAAALWNGKTRLAAIPCLFAAMALVIATRQVRGVPFAILLALPGLAMAIRLLAGRLMRPGWKRALALVAAYVLLSNLAISEFSTRLFAAPATRNASVAHKPEKRCTGKQLAATLAPLPPGRIVSLLDFAPSILLYSKDSVLAGNYHRGQAGIKETFRFFAMPPAAGAAIARRHGIDYVLLCRADGKYDYYLKQGGPAGLLAALNKGATPPWLLPVSAQGGFRLFRVVRGALPPAAH